MKSTLSVLSLAAVFALGGCGHFMHGGGVRAMAEIKPTVGNSVQGKVYFMQHGEQVHVRGKVSGLPPNTEHGFHVHEKNDCSGDGMKTGGHFNPKAKPHGGQTDEHHMGDMPNIKADANGVAKFHAVLSGVDITESDSGIINRAVIVHRDADDYKSQPAGNAGPRVACGLIVKG